MSSSALRSAAHAIFRKTNLVWTLGVPLFTLIFFVPYWFLIVRRAWGGRYFSFGSPAFYGYWLVALAVWLVIVGIDILCKRRRIAEKDRGQKSHNVAHEFLFNWNPFAQSAMSQATIPHTPNWLAIQPRRNDTFFEYVNLISRESVTDQEGSPQERVSLRSPVEERAVSTFRPKRTTVSDVENGETISDPLSEVRLPDEENLLASFETFLNELASGDESADRDIAPPRKNPFSEP